MLSRAARLRLVRLAKKAVEKIRLQGNFQLPSGISSKFIKVTESFGVRVSMWCPKDEVIDTFKNHCKAFTYGLAPYAFGFLELWDATGHKAYGYIVQTVKILNDWLMEESITPNSNNYAERCSGIPAIDKQGPKLYKRIAAVLGFECSDSHMGNAGWLGSTLVCVDFGKEGRC